MEMCFLQVSKVFILSQSCNQHLSVLENTNKAESVDDSAAIEKMKQDYDVRMQDLLKKYEDEVKHKEKLAEDINKLKTKFETDKEAAGASTRAEGGEGGEAVLQAVEKLHAIEEQMVGGEKANDAELKEKRAKKKKIAESRKNAMSEALSQLNDDDRLLLKAYGDITEELRAKSLLLKKAKRKLQSLEQEVRDLQSEFESERTDYLETIRRQEQQQQLLTQILEKIQPFLRSECNYANIEMIKAHASWDENSGQWIIPEISMGTPRVKLPPAAVLAGAHNHHQPHQNGTRDIAPSRIYKPDSPTSYFDSDIIDAQHSEMNGYEDRLLRKLENSENEEIVTKYFLPKRREQLLNNLHKLKLSEFKI